MKLKFKMTMNESLIIDVKDSSHVGIGVGEDPYAVDEWILDLETRALGDGDVFEIVPIIMGNQTHEVEVYDN